MHPLLERTETEIARHDLLARGDSILVAVSGGLDSMVLLHLLNTLAPAHGWKLTVAHFNHRLRGKAADADQRLVERTAKRLGLICVSDCGDVKPFAREHKLSIEMAARTLRHEFLATTAERLGIKTIAVAHHADDQAELILLRLLRGAGTRGLGGMQWHSPSPAAQNITLIRPLLAEPKSEMAAFARAERLRFREDATNACHDILRNRIRHKLLPLLQKQFQPGISKILFRTGELLRDDAGFIEQEAAKWLAARRAAFEELPMALQRRVLQEELHDLAIAADFDLVERLRLREGEWFAISAGQVCRRRSNGTVELKELTNASFRTDEVQLDLHAADSIAFSGKTLAWKIRPGTKLPRKSLNSEVFDADATGHSIVLRHWRAGDRFQPIGLSRPAKLQDLFVNEKIPRARRHELVLATTAAGEIFWVEGLRIGERFKITQRTRQQLHWRWDR